MLIYIPYAIFYEYELKLVDKNVTYTQRSPKWRTYERLAAALESENSGIELSVIPNARIKGKISQRSRQVDILIDARWGDQLSRRVIVDTKLHKRKLNIKDVESFEGMMKDCRADHGILISPQGWSQSAKRRAENSITIKLLTLEDIEEKTSWANFGECVGHCQSKSSERLPSGLVLWDGDHNFQIDTMWAVVFTGKCDVCHNFHVWCWDCGETIALDDEDMHECYCGRTWVSAIEEEISDLTGKTLNAVHLLMIIDSKYWALDRRPLR